MRHNEEKNTCEYKKIYEQPMRRSAWNHRTNSFFFTPRRDPSVRAFRTQISPTDRGYPSQNSRAWREHLSADTCSVARIRATALSWTRSSCLLFCSCQGKTRSQIEWIASPNCFCQIWQKNVKNSQHVYIFSMKITDPEQLYWIFRNSAKILWKSRRKITDA